MGYVSPEKQAEYRATRAQRNKTQYFSRSWAYTRGGYTRAISKVAASCRESG